MTIVCDGPSVVLESLAFLVLPQSCVSPLLHVSGDSSAVETSTDAYVAEWPIIR